eukprot:15786735-Heterocapsa_arctica.AAC.1
MWGRLGGPSFRPGSLPGNVARVPGLPSSSSSASSVPVSAPLFAPVLRASAAPAAFIGSSGELR